MDDIWGFDTNLRSTKALSSDYHRKWEGEDEDEYVMESWDQEPEDFDEDASVTNSPDRSDESGHTEDSSNTCSTPQPLENLQHHSFDEEGNLDVTKEVFGIGEVILDSEESYARFKTKLLSVIDESTKNIHYTTFTEDVVQNLCHHLTSNELKSIVIRLSNLQIQKNSAKKGDKKKQKGKSKVKLRVEDDLHDYSEYSAYLEEDGYM